MAKFFSTESKAMQFFARLWDMFLLNLLFLAGALPVVTVGVSLTAAYAVGLKIVEDRDDSVVRAFFRAYKANFRQGIVLWLANVLLLAAVALDFYLFYAVENNPIVFLILGILSAGLVGVHFFYAYPLAARYDNSLFRHLTNSRSIFFRYFGRSILCVLMQAFIVWLFFFNDLLLIYIGIFIAPVLLILTGSFFAMKVFRKIETQNEQNAEAANAAADAKPGEGAADEPPPA